MSATIKIIDLLNKIANGEEVPEKVKYCGSEYLYLNHRKDYKNMELDFDSCIIDSKYHNLDWLNDTVEIIEEQEEIDIQEIEELENWYVDKKEEYREFDIYAINLCFKKHQEKINELVQAVKQLDKKIKEK